MATYRDYALADYQARLASEIAAEDQAKAALATRAQNALVPVFTDLTAKLVADPTKMTAARLTDLDNGLVVLETTDGSVVAFAVYPDLPDPEVYMTQLVDEAWVRGPRVRDLDDVGEYLTTGEVG